MPRKPTYTNEADRKAAKNASQMQWYNRNREAELLKMRARYDQKVAIPQDRDRREQGPRPTQPVHAPDKRLVQRSIRRIRQLDNILRGASSDGNLTTYAEEVYDNYLGHEREEALLMLIDLESGISMHLKSIDTGVEVIRQEVGIMDTTWKEGNAIRGRYALMQAYIEDMRQWAEKQKLRVRHRHHQLLFQQD